MQPWVARPAPTPDFFLPTRGSVVPTDPTREHTANSNTSVFRVHVLLKWHQPKTTRDNLQSDGHTVRSLVCSPLESEERPRGGKGASFVSLQDSERTPGEQESVAKGLLSEVGRCPEVRAAWQLGRWVPDGLVRWLWATTGEKSSGHSFSSHGVALGETKSPVNFAAGFIHVPPA